ncbi:MAG: TOBE domain-containing protein, partial [Kiritimatiellae bacterium]|nr:TOBE domain-containing protein [Kiritimatiellia bacterium]
LLLDEPVSALDENTRDSVCIELRKLHEELGITTIHVSHNLEEAFSVADRGGILNNGVFEQTGTLDELLRRPTNEFTARFMRCGNIFTGYAKELHKSGESTYVDVHNTRLLIQGTHKGEIKFIVRPENIQLQSINNTEYQTTETLIPIKVTRIVDRGAYVRIDLDNPIPLTAHIPHYAFINLHIQEGSRITAIIKPEMIHILPT